MLFLKTAVSNKDNITGDLYNTLEELKYPEVAQINFAEFEVEILTGKKRVDLLHWILQENQNFSSNLLNKFKESSLEGKLFKCYSQMGFCSNEDVLLGKCKIDEQLNFLSLLTQFIKRTLIVGGDSLKCDKETANSLLKTNVVGEGPKKIQDTVEDTKSLESSNSLVDQRRNDFENLYSNIKLNLEGCNKEQTNNYEPVLQKFHTSFKNVTSIPAQNSKKSCNNPYNFNQDIQQMHTKFSCINKALMNEVELNNRLVPENTDKAAKPLSLMISDNVVLIEQACNMLKENQASSSDNKL